MKFKLDENLPVELADDFRAKGYDADTVNDERLQGFPDIAILEAANLAGRILLTLDKGIANLREYPAHLHAGVVLFRPDASGRRAVLTFIRARLEFILGLELNGHVTVVSADRVRRR